MFYFVLSFHLLLCVSLVGLVLLQQGKGADLGAALGGSSQSVFGAAGASGLLIKVTTSIAILFMVTSVVLVKLYQERQMTPSSVTDPLVGSVMQGYEAQGSEAQGSKIQGSEQVQPQSQEGSPEGAAAEGSSGGARVQPSEAVSGAAPAGQSGSAESTGAGATGPEASTAKDIVQ